ncbi:hypothetical protein Tco_0833899 [Tanacetum coccineum]
MADMVEANQALEERLDKQGSRLYKLENLNIPHQVSKAVDEIVTDAVDWAIQAPLRDRFRELPEADMKEILHHRIWESNSYQAHEDHKMLYEALEKSMARDHTDQLLTDLAEARRKKKKRHASPKTPPGSPPYQPPPPPPPAGSSGTPGASGAFGSSQLPPPPPPLSTNQSDQSISTAAPSSSKTAVAAEYTAWTTTDTRLKPFVSSIPEELHMDDDTTPDEQVQSSGDEDIDHNHIPTASALASTYAPPPENSLLTQTSDMAIFMDWFCKKQWITELKQQDGTNITQRTKRKQRTNKTEHGMEKTKSNRSQILGDLRYGRSLHGCMLSISKIKAGYYPNVGIEQMVPNHMWIEEECKYDIAAMYGISHWWFQRQQFYIDRYISEGDRKAVRTHMRILSVFRIKVFSLYGYNYMKKIVLRRADLKEYTIAERDFKNLYPSDFEDLYLLHLQGHLDHLPPKDKKILTTTVNFIRQRVEDFQLGIETTRRS